MAVKFVCLDIPSGNPVAANIVLAIMLAPTGGAWNPVNRVHKILFQLVGMVRIPPIPFGNQGTVFALSNFAALRL